MASYTIRIELRNAVAEDYQQLRRIMKEHGYKRSLICKAGVNFWLPEDEYTCVSFDCRQEILDKVYGLAQGVRVNPAVLVTESLGRTWRGLQEIDY